jgi:serine/threonine protein phosphatase PrpC
MNSMEQKFQQFQTQSPPTPRSHVALWIRLTALLSLALVAFLLYRLPGSFPPPSWLKLAALVRDHQTQPAPALLITALQSLALLFGWAGFLLAALRVTRLWRFDPRAQLAHPPHAAVLPEQAEEAQVGTAHRADVSRSQVVAGSSPGVPVQTTAHPSPLAANRPGDRARETLVPPRLSVEAHRFDRSTLHSLLSASTLGTHREPLRPPMDGSSLVPSLLREGPGAGMRLAVSAICQPPGADEGPHERAAALFSSAGFYPKPETAQPGRAPLLPLGLFLLSDGFAFQEVGGFASTDQVAVESGALALLPLLFDHPASSGDEAVGRRVLDAIQHANVTLYRRLAQAQEEAVGRAVGTTLAVLLVLGTTAFVASVGNSRVYLFRAGEGLVQVTYDHAPPPSEDAQPRQEREPAQEGEQREQGELFTERAAPQAGSPRLYRSLGLLEQVDPDLFSLQLEVGDLLLLCSDGLWSRVEHATLEGVLRGAAEMSVVGPHRACCWLGERVLSAGGVAPFSLIVVQTSAMPEEEHCREDANEFRVAALEKGAGGGQ